MLAYLAADAQSLQHLLFPLQSPHATPYPVAMRVAVLEFAISVMDTQPAVAGLLLNTAAPKKARRAVRFAGGEEEAKDKAGADGGAAASSASAGEAGKGKATGGFHRPSVVLEVLDVLETAEHHLDHNPRLLSVALHLLLGIFREGTMPLSRVRCCGCGCGCGCVAARALLCCSHACLPLSRRRVVAPSWMEQAPRVFDTPTSSVRCGTVRASGRPSPSPSWRTCRSCPPSRRNCTTTPWTAMATPPCHRLCRTTVRRAMAVAVAMAMATARRGRHRASQTTAIASLLVRPLWRL